MVKFGAQAFTYGLAFAVCGVVALTVIKFTKPDEEKIRVLEQKYGKSAFNNKNNEKMQSMLNNLKEGKVGEAQERQYRELMGKGSDSNSMSKFQNNSTAPTPAPVQSGVRKW